MAWVKERVFPVRWTPSWLTFSFHIVDWATHSSQHLEKALYGASFFQGDWRNLPTLFSQREPARKYNLRKKCLVKACTNISFEKLSLNIIVVSVKTICSLRDTSLCLNFQQLHWIFLFLFYPGLTCILEPWSGIFHRFWKLLKNCLPFPIIFLFIWLIKL